MKDGDGLTRATWLYLKFREAYKLCNCELASRLLEALLAEIEPILQEIVESMCRRYPNIVPNRIDPRELLSISQKAIRILAWSKTPTFKVATRSFEDFASVTARNTCIARIQDELR